MFRTVRKSLMVMFAVVLAVAVNGRSAEATILTFEQSPFLGDDVGTYESTYAAYGDNVTATTAPGPGTTFLYGMGNGFTPDITVGYTSSPGATGGHSAFGPQAGWSDAVDYLRYFDGSSFWFTFTPSGAAGVDINSFAIDIYAGGGQIDWNLRQDTTTGTIFASGTETGLTQAGPDRIITIPDGEYYGTTILEVTISGTSNFGNIGLDDLNFDQLAPPPAPEPTTGLLLALGGLGMMTARQRTRRMLSKV